MCVCKIHINSTIYQEQINIINKKGNELDCLSLKKNSFSSDRQHQKEPINLPKQTAKKRAKKFVSFGLFVMRYFYCLASNKYIPSRWF